MQPYQEASEELRRQGQAPINALKKAASIGLSAGSVALGAGIGGISLNRVLPFLSKYIPQDLAIKGLSKIDPRFGTFINKALSAGKSIDEVKSFIKEKAVGNESQEKKENPKDQRNIIEQYSPELHQFLKGEVTKGRPAIEAGAIAQSQDKFKNVIKKLESDHKTNFSSILESIYGGGQYAAPATQTPQPKNNIDESLIAALHKILKM